MSALVTEHFILQSAASTTTSEASSRASLYLATLSSAMVAMGFASQSPHALVPLAASVLPVVFLLGLFTFVRLVDVSVENIQLLAGMARIRGFYRTLGPRAPYYFGVWSRGPDVAGESDHNEALAMIGARRHWSTSLFTMASMVALVNSALAGVGGTLLLAYLLGSGWLGLAVPVGVLLAAALMFAAYRYQRASYDRIVPSDRLAPAVSMPEPRAGTPADGGNSPTDDR
jgi:hypothetical protein